MATSTMPRNKDRIFKKIIALLYDTQTSHEADMPVGASTANRAMKRVWVCAGEPTGAAPTGMAAGDLILDTTNDEVYRYMTGTTYEQMKV